MLAYRGGIGGQFLRNVYWSKCIYRSLPIFHSFKGLWCKTAKRYPTLKTIPCSTTHIRVGQIRQCLPPGPQFVKLKFFRRASLPPPLDLMIWESLNFKIQWLIWRISSQQLERPKNKERLILTTFRIFQKWTKFRAILTMFDQSTVLETWQQSSVLVQPAH